MFESRGVFNSEIMPFKAVLYVVLWNVVRSRSPGNQKSILNLKPLRGVALCSSSGVLMSIAMGE